MHSPSETTGSTKGSANSPQGREATSRADLIEQARRGDPRALQKLLVEARPRAIAVALKVLRNPEDAEDAVQDAFVKAWRYMSRFEGRASFGTWLHRIVMNASLDLLRRHSCRPEGEDDDANRLSELAHHDTPERSLGRAQTSAVVRAAVATLAAPHRQAITLREFEDRSYEEIARASKCPVGTVMSRLHHARRKLATELRGSLNDDLVTAAAA